MKLNKMKKEELETMPYSDLAETILLEEKKSLNTPTIFKKICKLLELSDEEYAEGIGDFYTSLTTDKRFILLDNACWDLRDKHKVEIVLDDEDEEDDEETIEEAEEEPIEESEDEDNIDEEVNDDDDDLEDLTILDEEDMEE